MTAAARPTTASRIGGILLIVAGAGLLVIAPVALFYLAALGCGMNTTGCRNFTFPWEEMARYALPVMLFAAAVIWGGWRMARHPVSGWFSIGLIIALGGIVTGYLWMTEWYGSNLFGPGIPWGSILSITGPPLAIGAAMMVAGWKARKRWLATQLQL